MQSKFFLLIFIFAALFSSCDENSITDMGSALQTDADKIVVGADTFHLDTKNYWVDYIVSRPDSFLLGTFIDSHFGTTNADLFMQVEPPINFKFPEGFVADSAELVLQYRSWFGYKFSPMEISVYTMDKAKTFDYSTTYLSNINVNEYTSKSTLLGKKSFTARDALYLNTDSTTLKMKLGENFDAIKSVLGKEHTSLNQFLNVFPGLYVTSNFGSATLLHVSSAVLRYHFHYTYATKIDNRDTVITASAYLNFPANSWVRQVNRVEHPNREAVRQKLEMTDSVNYISSPAKVYTHINLPIDSMKARINNTLNKKLNINSAHLKVYVATMDDVSEAQRPPEYVLLVRDTVNQSNTSAETYKDFFKKRQLPNNVSSVLGSYTAERNTKTNEISYFYSFDLALLVANELKNTNAQNVRYLLVPVSVKQNSSGAIIEVKEQNLMRSVSIYSGNNAKRPMKLNLVYSLF